MSTRPRSTFQRSSSFLSYANRSCDPNQATTMRPSVAGEALAYVDSMCLERRVRAKRKGAPSADEV
jgi:hypothetical protein